MSHIPLPVGAIRRATTSTIQPAFGPLVRWTLVVLSWLAFSVAGYLAFHAVTGSSVAGCGLITSANGCDVVQSSSWSKWLGVPVAILGLGCYATLASLSILLGLRREPANRWITTAFVLLAVVAAGASTWFIGLQWFAIGAYCEFCLVTDGLGILIGLISVGATLNAMLAARGQAGSRPLPAGLISMRPATNAGRAHAPAVPLAVPPPSLLGSLAGALPLLIVLIGGQLLFATKTYQTEKVALNNAIKFDEGKSPDANESGSQGTTRVAMRVPSESETDGAAANINEATQKNAGAASDTENTSTPSAAAKADDAGAAPSSASPPARQRLVKFLGGKLTLDVYKHPLIGSPEAPHIVIEMVSYDCPHCRKMHPMVEDALARYGDQVAVLVMPVPLDKDCNKLITDPTISHPGACGTARMVIGLAKLAPGDFAKFHDFLMAGKEKPPEMGKIIPKAYGFVNADRLRELTRGPEVNKQLAGYVDLYGQLSQQSHGGAKTFGLPVQILGDYVVSGEVEKPEDVFKAWEEHLGVTPK